MNVVNPKQKLAIGGVRLAFVLIGAKPQTATYGPGPVNILKIYCIHFEHLSETATTAVSCLLARRA